MENFVSKIKNTAERIKNTPQQIKKTFLEKTTLGLNRYMPQPNEMDNTIDEVIAYNVQASHNQSSENSINGNNNFDIAA